MEACEPENFDGKIIQSKKSFKLIKKTDISSLNLITINNNVDENAGEKNIKKPTSLATSLSNQMKASIAENLATKLNQKTLETNQNANILIQTKDSLNDYIDVGKTIRKDIFQNKKAFKKPQTNKATNHKKSLVNENHHSKSLIENKIFQSKKVVDKIKDSGTSHENQVSIKDHDKKIEKQNYKPQESIISVQTTSINTLLDEKSLHNNYIRAKKALKKVTQTDKAIMKKLSNNHSLQTKRTTHADILQLNTLIENEKCINSKLFKSKKALKKNRERGILAQSKQSSNNDPDSKKFNLVENLHIVELVDKIPNVKVNRSNKNVQINNTIDIKSSSNEHLEQNKSLVADDAKNMKRIISDVAESKQIGVQQLHENESITVNKNKPIKDAIVELLNFNNTSKLVLKEIIIKPKKLLNQNEIYKAKAIIDSNEVILNYNVRESCDDGSQCLDNSAAPDLHDNNKFPKLESTMGRNKNKRTKTVINIEQVYQNIIKGSINDTPTIKTNQNGNNFNIIAKHNTPKSENELEMVSLNNDLIFGDFEKDELQSIIHEASLKNMVSKPIEEVRSRTKKFEMKDFFKNASLNLKNNSKNMLTQDIKTCQNIEAALIPQTHSELKMVTKKQDITYNVHHWTKLQDTKYHKELVAAISKNWDEIVNDPNTIIYQGDEQSH